MSSKNTGSLRPVPEYLPTAGHFDGRGQAPNSFDIPVDQGGFFGGDIQLREYWRVVFKYRVIITACAIVGMILALVYAFTATPRYAAESKIRISTYEPVLSATKIEDMLEQKSKENNYFETQLEEIKSYSLADKVLQDPAMAQAFRDARRGGGILAWFGLDSETTPGAGEGVGTYVSPIGEIRGYLGGINVKPIRRTSLVIIEATSSSPTLAALVANKHATAYIDWVRVTRVEQQARGLSFLRGQEEELRQKVADLEREMADYAEQNSIVAVNKDENITAQKMSQLNKLLTDTTAKRIEAEQFYNESEANLNSDSAGFDDPSTQAMRTELARYQAEYAQLSAKFTNSYPKVQQLQSQIAGLKSSIQAQRRQIVLGLKAKYLAAEKEEKNLKEELEQQTSRAYELAKRQVQYNVLNRDLTASRELLQNVSRQIKETSLAVESNSSNVSVVDFAVTPTSPSYPRKRLMVTLGVLIGLGVGIAAAFLLNYLDDTIRTPEELMRILSLPSLGVVPSFAIDTTLGMLPPPAESKPPVAEGDPAAPPAVSEGSGSDLPIVYVKNPRSLASEAYRTIRTGILLSQAGQPPRTILISSAQSSEGKTTSSINLAASLASAGGRVVLIDADLRRPSVYRHFNLNRDMPGLVEVITGQCTIGEVAIKDMIKRITLIPSGKTPPNPAELLGSMEMASIIDELSAEFDYVLIDSPPVLPVTDSVILSRYVDGVVLVVKGGSTPKKVIKDAKQRLAAVGARFLGTVLNDVDITGGDYYYYNRYYYSYYQDNEAAGRRGESI